MSEQKPTAATVLELSRAYAANLARSPAAPRPDISLAPRGGNPTLLDRLKAQTVDLDMLLRHFTTQALQATTPEEAQIWTSCAVRVQAAVVKTATALADLQKPRPTVIEVVDAD